MTRVFDQSLSGKSMKMLTLIDEFTRECLAVEVGISIKSERVRNILQRVCAKIGKPELIRSDNGSEFIGKAVNEWLTENGIKPLFIEPGEIAGKTAKAKVSTENCGMNV